MLCSVYLEDLCLTRPDCALHLLALPCRVHQVSEEAAELSATREGCRATKKAPPR